MIAVVLGVGVVTLTVKEAQAKAPVTLIVCESNQMSGDLRML